ncbi:MAG: amidohydrolase family protein [Bryobacterales bacterium]|nr:amidohydrolase family protein [Bryobacterales bacterium]MBV9400918.1 amidohydrolase family protein [Bryobacterales bacterium]
MRPLTVFAIFSAAVWAGDTDTFLLRNVDVYAVVNASIKDGAILVVDGKIAEIGSKIVPSKGLRIIDGKGLRAYPGMIDSGTELGLAEVSDVRATVDTAELGVFMPQLRALVAVNAESEHFPVARANGITSVLTFPSSNGNARPGGERQIISGQAALIHMDGWTWEELAVNRSAALHLIFPSLPANQASGYAEAKRVYDRELQQIDDFFDQARRYRIAKVGGAPGFKTDLKMEAMLPVLEGKLPVAISAAREQAIRDAIQFAGRQQVRMVLLHPREWGKTAPELKARNIPVILGPTLDLPLNEDDAYDSSFTLPAEAFRAGLKIAFGTFDNEFVRNLPYNAATAVAYGLPYEEALKAVTINAAEIWGVRDQIGSIEKGKLADLMLTTGDPLETQTEVRMLFIKGKQVDLTNRHTRLYQKYLNRP